jgi:hypothetical protein
MRTTLDIDDEVLTAAIVKNLVCPCFPPLFSPSQFGADRSGPHVRLTEFVLSVVAKIQSLFDALYTFRKPVVPRMLIGHIAVKIGAVSPKTRNSRL